MTCYSGLPCYYGLTRTFQSSGIPAAGNGDSGGPVFQIFNINGEGHVYASGVVSGVYNYSSVCTGEQNRNCSDLVSYAPLSKFFWNNTSYGLAIVP